VRDGSGSAAKLLRRFTFVVVLSLLFSSFNAAFVSLGVAPTANAAPGSLNVNLDQWANASPASWQNGNLNGNNSQYGEGRVVPFRLAIEGLEPGQHSFHINYDWTAGGHKAYDFLATYNATESSVTGQECSSGGGAVSSLCPSLPAPVLAPFQPDTHSSNGRTVNGAIAFSGLGANRFLYAYGVTAVSVSAPTYAGSDTGNSTADVVVTFTTAGSAAFFLWGGHLAQSIYWDVATPNGAGQISGAPWHMRTQDLDGSGNKNQDRSIQPSALVPALSIVKTADAANVNAGSQIGFTVTVTNSGPGDALNVVLSDTLPSGSGIVWSVDAAGSDSGCAIVSGLLTCNFGGIVQNGSKHVHVISSTTLASCAVYNNVASASSSNSTPVQSAQATITVANCAAPDVAIAKSGNGPLNAGQTATFTITVTAGGTGTSSNVTLTDTLPAGTWTLGGADAAACSIASGSLTCNFGTMASGTSKTITLGRTTTSADCPAPIANTASVNATGDTDPTNNSASASITVTCAPDVSILKTGGDAVSAGGIASFTITVTASATGSSSSVTVSDTLPTGTWTLSGADAAQCAIAAGVLTCTFGTMAEGTSKSVTLSRVTTAQDCPSITNTATVTATGDTNTGNNSSTASVTVNCGQILVAKTADQATVVAGGTIGFVISIANLGAGTATGVVISDTLPSAGSLVWTIDAANSDTGCAISAGVLTCTFGDLGPLATRTVHVTSPTTGADCGTIRNVATATSTNDSGGEASDSIVVSCHPDVSVVKTGSGPVIAGGSATFTIIVSAAGTGSSSNVTLSDTLPSGAWTLGGTDAAQCSIASGALSCTFGTMASGTSKTITLTRATTLANCPSIANTATVNATGDSNLTNNSSSASVTVNCPNVPETPQLTVSKTADATLVTAAANGGTHVGFTVTLTNSGPIATTAVLTDTPLVAPGPTTPAGNAGTLGLTWTIDAAGSDAGCSINTGTLSCSFGTLQPGANKHVHITAAVTARTSSTSRNDNCGQRVDNMATVTIGNGTVRQSNHATVDIACLPTTAAAALTITKYADNNANALKDAGEANLAGWTFEVKNTSTGATYTATTGANGSVVLGDLEFGQYTVTEKSCTSPCDLSKWKPISYVIGGQATVSSRSGTAQIAIAAAEQSITFGNQPPLLPSTSTQDDDRDRTQSLLLLLIAGLVAQILVLRVVARLSART
jgi:uncharacterized repeat protein (TIGR01451 family)